MKERISYLDSIRGFAILLMVVGHVIAWSYPNWHEVCLFLPSQPTNVMAGGAVWQLIYSFHMAVFFMVSGYLMGNMVVKNHFLDQVKRKLFRLLIPYFSTGIVLYAIYGRFGYWFLIALFELSLLWFCMSLILSDLNKESSWWKDLACMCLFYILLRLLFKFIPEVMILIDTNVLRYFIPFCLGAMLSRHPAIECFICRPFVYTICLVGFVLLFMTRYLTDYPGVYEWVKRMDFFLSVSAVLACVVVFQFFRRGVDGKMERWLMKLGVLSLPIYILHPLFVIRLTCVGEFWLQQHAVTSVITQCVYGLLIALLAIALSVCAYRFLRQSDLLRLVLFGEKKE
jgi:fucose 4-O-acetylase-like acetyltransferase